MTPRSRRRNPLAMPVETVALSNGLRCLLRPLEANEIVALICFLDITVFDESEKHAGLASFVQRLLCKGTARRSALELSMALESMGAALSSGMTEDYGWVTIQATRGDLAKAVDLMAEILWEPAFATKEVQNERQQVLAEIRLMEDDKFYLAYKHFRKALYGSHPYGRPVEGTPETIARLSSGLCRQWHRRFFVPRNCLLVAVGAFEPRALVRRLNARFSKRPSGTAGPRRNGTQMRSLTTYRPRRMTVAKRVEQALCIVGWPATSVENLDDAVALKLASALLGAGMSSRLFIDLRERRGLAYAVGCSYPLRRTTSHFFAYIGTKPQSAAQATRAMIHAVQDLARNPVGPGELERTKTYLKGIYLMDHQTNARQAWHLGWSEIVGLGHEFDARWPELIDKVTPDDIRRAAHRYLTTPTIVTIKPQQR